MMKYTGMIEYYHIISNAWLFDYDASNTYSGLFFTWILHGIVGWLSYKKTTYILFLPYIHLGHINRIPFSPSMD